MAEPCRYGSVDYRGRKMHQVRLSRSLIFLSDKQPFVAAPYCATALKAAAGGVPCRPAGCCAVARPVGLWRAMLLGQGSRLEHRLTLQADIAGPAGRS